MKSSPRNGSLDLSLGTCCSVSEEVSFLRERSWELDSFFPLPGGLVVVATSHHGTYSHLWKFSGQVTAPFSKPHIMVTIVSRAQTKSTVRLRVVAANALDFQGCLGAACLPGGLPPPMYMIGFPKARKEPPTVDPHTLDTPPPPLAGE